MPALRPAAWSWVGAALVAAVAGVLYLNSLDGALIYDDTNAIVRNRVVIDEDFGGILTTPSWWRAGHGRGWRPLTTASFAANHVVHGLEPWGYHAVNVALHAGVSVLVLVTFARVTGGALTAVVAALLFAAHPVHTEAIASVVGRSELLAAAAFLLAWVCFLRGDVGRRWLHEGAGVTIFFLGLLAKENTITLLPVLLLADLVYPHGAAGPRATLRRHVGRYGAMVVAVVLYVVLRRLVIGPGAPGGHHLDNPLVSLPLGPRLLTAVHVIGLYAWRLIAPLRLAADYSYDQIGTVTSPLDAGFLAGLAMLVAIPAICWWSRARMPALALGLGMLALTFSLVANLGFLIGTIMAERLVYLPSAGFCLALAAVLVRVTGGETGWGPGRDAGRHLAAALVCVTGGETGSVRPRGVRTALPIAVVVLVGLYGARTWVRNPVWHDPEVFFTTMVAEAPRSARSHRELGGVLADLGRHDEAQRAFERSLAIEPDDAATLHNFGNALVRRGDLDAAAQAYERAIAAKPDFVDAMMNLATVEERRGRLRIAVDWLRRGLEYQPVRAGLHMNLANTLFQAGRLDAARAEYEAALAADPDAVQIRLNYGIFLYAQRDYARAIAVYEPASAESVQAAVGLATAYAAHGNGDAARAALRRAEQRFPGHPTVASVRRRLAGAIP